MSRLKKIASNDLKNAKILLNRIDEASHNLKDVYYVLFDNLNALYKSYPDLYKQIEMVVALPKNEDAANVVQFDSDLNSILTHLNDDQYLNSYINPSKTNNQFNKQDNNFIINQDTANDQKPLGK